MSNLPSIKPLKPVVQYDPRDAPKNNYGTGGNSGKTIEETIPFLNFTRAVGSMFPVTNPDILGRVAHGQGAAQIGGEQPVISDPRDAGVVSATPTVSYTPPVHGLEHFLTPQPSGGSPSGAAANPSADRRYDALEESRMRQMAAMNTAVNNNRNNAAAAAASGNNAEKARLDAEWARLTASPLYQAMWGQGNEQAMKERLVNVYMDPKNSAAQQDFASAAARAASDDIWAREATNAFGRPPTQSEWDDHWRAMNVGGRDPLEGHPQAIQNIKAAATGLSTGNQQTVYDQYNKWLGH